MRKIALFLIIPALLFPGCESSEQLSGVFMGGSLGGFFGSSIGGMTGGPRGADTGRTLGILIGGATGAAITAPKNGNTQNIDSYENYSQVQEVDTYNRRNSKRGGNQMKSRVNIPEEYSNLQIENLRFIDQNENRILNVSERAQLVFEIRNNGNQTIYDVTPVVNSSDAKHILISPTAIIGAIAPGKLVRYKAELYGKRHLRSGSANFTISFAIGNWLYTVRKFRLFTDSDPV